MDAAGSRGRHDTDHRREEMVMSDPPTGPPAGTDGTVRHDGAGTSVLDRPPERHARSFRSAWSRRRTATPETRAATGPRTSALRVPAFSALAPFLGWLMAWGGIVIAAGCLERAGVATGFNLGIASGGPGADGFLPALWLLLVSLGAFLIGGYGAARMARAHGTTHAALMWVVAMVATGADAIIDRFRDGAVGVVRTLQGVPFWDGTGMQGDGRLALVALIFAAVSLAGALIGGALAQGANRRDRRDDVVVSDRRDRPEDVVVTERRSSTTA
jgi:hypothetical protein